MWRIAFKTLVSDRGKLLTALAGVLFSVVLVNVQGGLFIGLINKTKLLVDQGRADIWVGHQKMHNVDFTQDIPRDWVYRIKSVPGVLEAEPYLVGHAYMSLPRGGFELVSVLGINPQQKMGTPLTMSRGRADAIRLHDGIIVDESEMEKLIHPRLGEVREINGKKARIVGFSQGIAGFLVTPYVFTSLDRAEKYLSKSDRVCSYILVKIKPGENPEEVCRRVRSRIPDGVAYTTSEYGRLSVNYWMTRTGLGISFGAAALLGVIIGLVIVAQTLYASVLDRLKEFATLKALGARENQILSILLFQALGLAVCGALAGLFVVQIICRMWHSSHAPIVIPWWLALGSAFFVAVICLFAALLPYLRVRRIDPVLVMQN